MEGKIVLLVFPQDTQHKLRPAFILREFPKYNDLLICGISSQIHQYIPGFDLLLDEKHPDFASSGLKAPGVFRLNMLMMTPKSFVNGAIGKLSSVSHLALLKNLSDYLIKK